MKKPRRIKLGGRWWRLAWVNEVKSSYFPGQKLAGLCDYKTKTIHVGIRQEPREVSETLIHEALHAIFPFLKEECVEQAAEELNTALWSAGFTTEQ